MSLSAYYQQLGATLAPDGIPLHFGDLKAEYYAALQQCILLDRSHEGRITLSGADRFDLLNRMSTNNMLNMQPGEGRATIFTNPNARILDRVMVYHRSDDELLMLTSPGRGQAMAQYFKRNIFYNDKVILRDLAAETHLFALHGVQADTVMQRLVKSASGIESFYGRDTHIDEIPVFIGKVKPLVESAWVILVATEFAEAILSCIMQAGAQLAGSLTYNTLRIRAGMPARELSTDYIPLELGLWDEVSFNKGCYTGQEIIARMESRNRLAKTLVRLDLSQYVEAPTEVFHQGKRAGMITSSVLSPDDEIFAIGVIKTEFAKQDTQLNTSDGVPLRVSGLLGVQPLAD